MLDDVVDEERGKEEDIEVGGIAVVIDDVSDGIADVEVVRVVDVEGGGVKPP